MANTQVTGKFVYVPGAASNGWARFEQTGGNQINFGIEVVMKALDSLGMLDFDQDIVVPLDGNGNIPLEGTTIATDQLSEWEAPSGFEGLEWIDGDGAFGLQGSAPTELTYNAGGAGAGSEDSEELREQIINNISPHIGSPPMDSYWDEADTSNNDGIDFRNVEPEAYIIVNCEGFRTSSSTGVGEIAPGTKLYNQSNGGAPGGTTDNLFLYMDASQVHAYSGSPKNLVFGDDVNGDGHTLTYGDSLGFGGGDPATYATPTMFVNYNDIYHCLGFGDGPGQFTLSTTCATAADFSALVFVNDPTGTEDVPWNGNDDLYMALFEEFPPINPFRKSGFQLVGSEATLDAFIGAFAGTLTVVTFPNGENKLHMYAAPESPGDPYTLRSTCFSEALIA